MADNQRIHPVQDPEAPQAQKPTAPLVPRGSSRSDNGNPQEHHPPIRRTIPYSYKKPPPKRNCCFRCLCWTICPILLLIIILGISAAVIYFVFQPKIPKYSVDSMRITQFNLGNDMSLSATFNVNITARNPNKKIGIYYEGGSHLSVWFTGTKLCEGSLPKFYQGHRNTTVLNLSLSGQTDNASDLLQRLRSQQQTGNVPLNLRAKVPVRLKLGKLKLMKWKFLVKCRLNVNSLAVFHLFIYWILLCLIAYITFMTLLAFFLVPFFFLIMYVHMMLTLFLTERNTVVNGSLASEMIASSLWNNLIMRYIEKHFKYSHHSWEGIRNQRRLCKVFLPRDETSAVNQSGLHLKNFPVPISNPWKGYSSFSPL